MKKNMALSVTRTPISGYLKVSIEILWVTGLQQGSHVRYACAPSRSDFKEITYRSHKRKRVGHVITRCLDTTMYRNTCYDRVGTWLPCSRLVTHRISIKLQLTGKPCLIFQFYFVTGLCHKEITWDLKACDRKNKSTINMTTTNWSFNYHILC